MATVETLKKEKTMNKPKNFEEMLVSRPKSSAMYFGNLNSMQQPAYSV
jgi:hypothetical protein